MIGGRMKDNKNSKTVEDLVLRDIMHICGHRGEPVYLVEFIGRGNSFECAHPDKTGIKYCSSDCPILKGLRGE